MRSLKVGSGSVSLGRSVGFFDKIQWRVVEGAIVNTNRVEMKDVQWGWSCSGDWISWEAYQCRHLYLDHLGIELRASCSGAAVLLNIPVDLVFDSSSDISFLIQN